MSTTFPTDESDVRDAEGRRPRTGTVVGGLNGEVAAGLRAVILLGGRVRQTPFTTGIARSVLDLPLTGERLLLDAWLDEALGVVEATGQDRLHLRVVLDRGGISPVRPRTVDPRLELTVERDPCEFRGTAGVLRDVTREYDPDAWVLVASAAQFQMESLASLLADLSAVSCDVGVLSHADGTPSGTMLLRCRSLAAVAEVGYVDMKEQALPAIRKSHLVRVLDRATASALPIRHVADYVRAVRAHHNLSQGRPAIDDPFAERWEAEFTVVEEGAQVDPGATLVDSIVLAGATVEDGAVVVRSVVGPGAVVGRRTRVIGEIVGGEE